MMRFLEHNKKIALSLLLGGAAICCIAQNAPLAQPQVENKANLMLFAAIVFGILILVAVKTGIRLYKQNKQLEKDYALSLESKEIFHHVSLAIGAISHEIRTPLTIILGNLELIKTELDRFKGEFNGPSIEHFPDFFSGKIAATQHIAEGLSNYVVRILKFADNHYKEQDADYTTQIDILAMLRFGVPIVGDTVNKHGLKLHFETPLDKLVTDIELKEFADIMIHLFTNALKFTPKGGTITFGLDADGPGRMLGQPLPNGFDPTHFIFTFKDTGIGIPKKNLAKIFDRGFHTKPINDLLLFDDDAVSSGLGLFAVKNKVEHLKGTITVESKEGQGTTFAIRLPITRNAPFKEWVFGELNKSVELAANQGQVPFIEDAAATKAEASADGATLPTVLLIEDNKGIVDYIVNTFKGVYQVDIAYNGAVGIEKALENVPDIIITDLMMPEKNGYEVCEVLKQDLRTSHVPIIMLTALTDVKSRISGIKQGADAYIGKPAYREELVATINNLLESRRRLQERYLALATQQSAIPGDSAAPTLEAQLPENEFLRRLRNIIEEDLSDTELNVEAICRKIGMSRSNLHAKLSALTGMPITHFVRAIRLSKAKQLLTNSSMNVSEVATEVGFDNPSYFSRLFSEEFGMPPSAFRKDAQDVAS